MKTNQERIQALIDSSSDLSEQQVRKFYAEFLLDSCEDDTNIRKLAHEVLTEFEVEGDSWGVPTPVDIVETLVRRVQRLELQLARKSWRRKISDVIYHWQHRHDNEWGGVCPNCHNRDVEEGGDTYLLCPLCGKRIGWN
jgi:hypothetical protein